MPPKPSTLSYAEWEEEQIQDQLWHERALKLCEQYKREITGVEVAETLLRLGKDQDVVCDAIAKAIKANNLTAIGSLLGAQIENDLFETAKRDAGREE